jgi:hypothetical protein
MPRSMKVEIDAKGQVHPLQPSEPSLTIPPGRATLSWPTPSDDSTALLSEPSLAEDWLKPEEDAAWAHLQPGR